MSALSDRIAEVLRQAHEDALWCQPPPYTRMAERIEAELQQAGLSVVPTLGFNQCGNCQHWCWDHDGPAHPCKQCDCQRCTRPDPDRAAEDDTVSAWPEVES